MIENYESGVPNNITRCTTNRITLMTQYKLNINNFITFVLAISFVCDTEEFTFGLILFLSTLLYLVEK